MNLAKDLLRAIRDDPVAPAVLALGASTFGVNELMTRMGMSAFAADVATLAIICASIIFVWRKSSFETAGLIEVRILDASGSPIAKPETGRRRVSLRLVAILGLLALFVLTLRGPLMLGVALFPQGSWYMCGEFIADCGQKACIALYDYRERPLDSKCSDVDDDSGLVRLAAPSSTVYRPAYAAAQCSGRFSGRNQLESGFFDRTCTGRTKLR